MKKNTIIRALDREAQQSGKMRSVLDFRRILHREEAQDRIWQKAWDKVETGPRPVLRNPDDFVVYSLENIRQTAIRYRLRFLPGKHFTGAIPPVVATKARRLEKQLGVSALSYHILAPARAFELGDCHRDPLLFAGLGDGRYALIHSWGRDLHWSRVWKYWALRNWYTLLTSVLMIGLFVGPLLPESFLTGGRASVFPVALIGIFYTTMVLCAMFSLLGFSRNVRLSADNWNSPHFNS